jgi:hypothetical protein
MSRDGKPDDLASFRWAVAEATKIGAVGLFT